MSYNLVFLVLALCAAVTYTMAGHYIIPYHQPYDGYHDLHLPGAAPPRLPSAGPFNCHGFGEGLKADIRNGCQDYHLCKNDAVVSSHFCPEGTLFNEQFQVCDHFYNVRCGSPFEDL